MYHYLISYDHLALHRNFCSTHFTIEYRDALHIWVKFKSIHHRTERQMQWSAIPLIILADFLSSIHCIVISFEWSLCVGRQCNPDSYIIYIKMDQCFIGICSVFLQDHCFLFTVIGTLGAVHSYHPPAQFATTGDDPTATLVPFQVFLPKAHGARQLPPMSISTSISSVNYHQHSYVQPEDNHTADRCADAESPR